MVLQVNYERAGHIGHLLVLMAVCCMECAAWHMLVLKGTLSAEGQKVALGVELGAQHSAEGQAAIQGKIWLLLVLKAATYW